MQTAFSSRALRIASLLLPFFALASIAHAGGELIEIKFIAPEGVKDFHVQMKQPITGIESNFQFDSGHISGGTGGIGWPGALPEGAHVKMQIKSPTRGNTGTWVVTYTGEPDESVNFGSGVPFSGFPITISPTGEVFDLGASFDGDSPITVTHMDVITVHDASLLNTFDWDTATGETTSYSNLTIGAGASNQPLVSSIPLNGAAWVLVNADFSDGNSLSYASEVPEPSAAATVLAGCAAATCRRRGRKNI